MRHSWIAGLTVAILFSAVPQVACLTTDEEITLLTERRSIDLAQFPNPPWFDEISTWLDTQKDDGTWDDVNYLSGCDAQQANWPIQEHWNRLITFASAWTGLNPAVSSNWTQYDQLLSAVSKGIDYWFDNDYTESDCMGLGGQDDGDCPCGTPGLWNQNWYDQAILIPQLCSYTCLLIKDANLTDTQLAGCERIPLRSYVLRDEAYGSGGNLAGTDGHLTASNAVYVMQNSISLALFLENSTILEDAYTRIMALMTFSDEEMEDGIHRDGSFLQHDGILYNSNYGKDFLNAFIQVGGESVGTSFEAGNSTMEAIAAQVRGNEWILFVDEETGQEYWDFNAVGRFVAFATSDLMANSDINYNVTKLATATSSFSGASNVSDTIERLLSNGTEKLVGNKGLWASDLMVHRRESFIVTNKMLSNRSANTEYINTANPYGYHLGQGTLFSYVSGNEYKDIMNAWDWNLIPGTTVLLEYPTLSSSIVKYNGKKNFVGSVSNGFFGMSVEDYVDPYDTSISYQKAWFFLEDSVVVVTTNIQTNASSSVHPVITVLDNRAGSDGSILVDSKEVDASNTTTKEGNTLFYGGNGYLAYDDPFELTLFEGNLTGNWSKISTSTAGETTVPIFSAYTTISQDSFSYAFFPASSNRRLEQEERNPTAKPIMQNNITGVISDRKLGLAFWPGASNMSITLELRELGWANSGSVTISSVQPGAYLFAGEPGNKDTGMKLVATLSDPTQKLASASFALAFSGAKAKDLHPGKNSGCKQVGNGVSFEVDLPTGGMAGSSISREVYLNKL
ncbi:polysaccharide lyase family 8 protein [Calycina marina]|uniref:Polysaccharide lyase family 8 protein n=1 Tax=Calycina marina TaxID=1763456 RepID=A0A9P7YUI4_9HELO|nr:polysaccharide lyase family 8 protein [Calycina marina]